MATKTRINVDVASAPSGNDYHVKAVILFNCIYYLRDELQSAPLTGFNRRFPDVDIDRWWTGDLDVDEGELVSLVLPDVERRLSELRHQLDELLAADGELKYFANSGSPRIPSVECDSEGAEFLPSNLAEKYLDDLRRCPPPSFHALLAQLATGCISELERSVAHWGEVKAADWPGWSQRWHAALMVAQTWCDVFDSVDFPQQWILSLQKEADEAVVATTNLPNAHGPGFRCARWRGKYYSFTAGQAQVVNLLWSAFENGTPDVGDETLLLAADDKAPPRSLRDLFRGNLAWGEMIVPGGSKGSHRLA